MRGSIIHQVQTLFKESGINRIGKSKHTDKEAFRSNIDQKVTWHDIGQNTGIYSYSTADDYREIWITAGKYAKAHFGLKHIETITGEHLQAFLMSKIEAKVAHSTFMTYAAALEKLAVALNMYAEKQGFDTKYNFSNDIRVARKIAHKELERFDGVRSYANPEELIEMLEHPFKLIASIQHIGGARLDEVYGIMPSSLKADNRVTVKGKGGKVRDIKITPEDYTQLEAHLQKEGDFKFNKALYLYHLKTASEKSNQKYNASHGLRWNFAQNRMHELQKNGKVREQGLVIVSQEMGHERADITEHYLKS
jgi:integrase